MKRSFNALLFIIIVFLNTLPTFAARMINAADITIRCEVDSQFGMEVWKEGLVQHLPEVFPGGEASGNISIKARSNRAIPWAIWASSSGLAGESRGNDDILSVTISAYENKDGSGVTFAEDIELSDTPKTIYQCDDGEVSREGVMVECVFSVKTRPTTREDTYTGKIVLTLTE